MKIIEQSIEKKDDKGATKAIRNKTGSIVISNDYAQDIDTEEDWKEAVRKHKILFK